MLFHGLCAASDGLFPSGIEAVVDGIRVVDFHMDRSAALYVVADDVDTVGGGIADRHVHCAVRLMIVAVDGDGICVEADVATARPATE